MSIGDFPESLSQAMLVGVILVGGLGVLSLVLWTQKLPVYVLWVYYVSGIPELLDTYP